MPDTPNNETQLYWKAFLKSPLLLIMFGTIMALGYVINNWVVKPKDERIKYLEGQIVVWEKRQDDWILRRDQLQHEISELNRLWGGKQVLDSLK